jgi:hypothetical protein
VDVAGVEPGEEAAGERRRKEEVSTQGEEEAC